MERSLHLDRCTTEQQDIAIAKVELVIVVEVLVGDVPAAGNGDLSIHDERLVVHPLIEAAEIGGEVEELGGKMLADVGGWVIQTNLDIRVCIEREQILATHLEHEVVHEEPHVNAAVGGSQEVIHRNQPDVIRGEDEVLDVDRALGSFSEPRAQDQRHVPLFERVDASAGSHQRNQRREVLGELRACDVDLRTECGVGSNDSCGRTLALARTKKRYSGEDEGEARGAPFFSQCQDRSSRYSQAFASRHSRFTVRGERPSTCAVSSTVSPAKKRSSTMRS